MRGHLLRTGAVNRWSGRLADVSQNAHGLRVQEAYGRSILNSFHALWSLGAVLGGFMAAGALLMDLGLVTHLVSSAALFGGLALIAWTMALPPDPRDSLASSAASHHQGEARRKS